MVMEKRVDLGREVVARRVVAYLVAAHLLVACPVVETFLKTENVKRCVTAVEISRQQSQHDSSAENQEHT